MVEIKIPAPAIVTPDGALRAFRWIVDPEMFVAGETLYYGDCVTVANPTSTSDAWARPRIYRSDADSGDYRKQGIRAFGVIHVPGGKGFGAGAFVEGEAIDLLIAAGIGEAAIEAGQIASTNIGDPLTPSDVTGKLKPLTSHKHTTWGTAQKASLIIAKCLSKPDPTNGRCYVLVDWMG